MRALTATTMTAVYAGLAAIGAMLFGTTPESASGPLLPAITVGTEQAIVEGESSAAEFFASQTDHVLLKITADDLHVGASADDLTGLLPPDPGPVVVATADDTNAEIPHVERSEMADSASSAGRLLQSESPDGVSSARRDLLKQALAEAVRQNPSLLTGGWQDDGTSRFGSPFNELSGFADANSSDSVVVSRQPALPGRIASSGYAPVTGSGGSLGGGGPGQSRGSSANTTLASTAGNPDWGVDAGGGVLQSLGGAPAVSGGGTSSEPTVTGVDGLPGGDAVVDHSKFGIPNAQFWEFDFAAGPNGDGDVNGDGIVNRLDAEVQFDDYLDYLNGILDESKQLVRYSPSELATIFSDLNTEAASKTFSGEPTDAAVSPNFVTYMIIEFPIKGFYLPQSEIPDRRNPTSPDGVP